MSLTPADVEKIARLSRFELNADEQAAMLGELNSVFAMVEKMRQTDTDGIAPMTHPHDLPLRLREDTVTEADHAAEYQACAPDVRNRLYIVPQVIEE